MSWSKGWVWRGSGGGCRVFGGRVTPWLVCRVRRRLGVYMYIYIYSWDFVVVCKTFSFSHFFFSLATTYPPRSRRRPQLFTTTATTSPSVFKLASKSRLFFLFLRKKIDRVYVRLVRSICDGFSYIYTSIHIHAYIYIYIYTHYTYNMYTILYNTYILSNRQWRRRRARAMNRAMLFLLSCPGRLFLESRVIRLPITVIIFSITSKP